MNQALFDAPVSKLQAAALSALALCAACATPALPPGAQVKDWAHAEDCFNRDVRETLQQAERMALTCSGPEAAANANRTGVERATAYFNAAAAYTLLAAGGSSPPICEPGSGCFEIALELLAKSFVNQDDTLMGADKAYRIDTVDERFILRRRLVQAQALVGSAQNGGSSCAEPDRCFALASEGLAAQDLAAFVTRKDDPIAHYACESLGISAQIHLLRGAEHEYAAMADLRTVMQHCPSDAAGASLTLARMSLDRGETLRKSMLDSVQSKAPKTQSAALGLTAIPSYRDALRAAETRLPAYRGLGLVYLQLATLEPGEAPEHYAAAADAFEAAQRIAAAMQDASRPEDLERLGGSYLNLADTKGLSEAAASDRLIKAAIQSLAEAVALAPTYERQLRLAGAYDRSGRNEEAEAAYRSAIKTATDPHDATATLALARVLERTGKSDEALAVLQSGLASGHQMPAVRFEIARLQFARSNFDAVINDLSAALGALDRPQTADAQYMMSVAEVALRRPGWQTRARTLADQAAQANGSSARYSRQQCLAHILSGGPDVKSGASLLRCPAGDTAEGHLLRGMYFLKQAQLTDVSAYDSASQAHWRSILGLADESFQAGRNVLAVSAGAKSTLRFDDLARDVDLDATLAQGAIIVARCRRDVTIEPGSQAWMELEAFFGHYGVLKCSVS